MALQFNDLPEAVSKLTNDVSEIKRLLLERSNEQQTEKDKLLTIKEAGLFLNLSVPTIYGYVHRAEIPVSKKGKRLYFSKLELDQWIESGRKKTKQEIEAEADSYLKRKGADRG